MLGLSSKRILVVDDEKDFCESLKEFLQTSGNFDVRILEDSTKALKTAKKFKPEVILLDISMPKISGFRVLEELKKDPDTISIPVIILTGNADNESKIRASQLYCEDYLVKPVKISDLKEKIESIISNKIK